MTTDVTYRGNVSDPGDNLTETITTNTTAGGGTLVNSFAYSYDANKNKLKETIGGPLNPYGFGTTVGQEAAYDAEDRLTDWHRDDTLRDLNYALSLVGDWNTFTVEGVTETRTHGNAHELTNLAGGGNPGALTHDAKGNILTSPAHGSQTYTWDFDNQLKQAASGGTHKYYYDALGRRVMKHVAGENRLIFVHDGQQIIAEYKYTNGVIGIPGGIDAGTSTTSQTTQTTQTQDRAVIIGTRRGTATIQRKYVYSTYIDERCLMIDRTAKGALPAATEELFYYHRNNLYSTAAMTDAAGLVQERYAYDAYGNILLFGPDTGGALGTPITVSALGQPYTYTGRRLDDETENYQYRARYYQAPLGRFLGRDRILYGDGYNMYAYVGGRALVAVDGSGLTRDEVRVLPDAAKADLPALVLNAIMGLGSDGNEYSFYKSCNTNCAAGYFDCKNSGMKEAKCLELWENCRKFCLAGEEIKHHFDKDPTTGLSWQAYTALAVGMASLYVAGSEDTAVALSQTKAFCRVSPRMIRVVAGGLAVAATGFAVWDAVNTINAVDSKSNRLKLSQAWAHQVQPNLRGRGWRRAGVARGNRTLGVFDAGFMEATASQRAATGFWVTPCGTRKVLIYAKMNGKWIRATRDHGLEINDKQCLMFDEIFRIEMGLAFQSSQAAE